MCEILALRLGGVSEFYKALTIFYFLICFFFSFSSAYISGEKSIIRVFQGQSPFVEMQQTSRSGYLKYIRRVDKMKVINGNIHP